MDDQRDYAEEQWQRENAEREQRDELAAAQDAYGFDGSAYGIGDRVEIHPGTDLWMRGARYGTVVGMSLTPRDRVRVTLDKTGAKVWTASADTFRRAD